MHPKRLAIQNFKYDLPTERIAHHPLIERHNSKLLIYKDGIVEENIYKNIAAFLPEGSMMVFNDTKVIPARILFKKDTGAVIEIFCLEPFGMEKDYTTVMSKKGSSDWKAMIGGAAKWKSGALKKIIRKDDEDITLEVSLIEKLEDSYVARFTWQPEELSFAEIIQLAGAMPLPPYIKRDAEQEDKDRYQTIYANLEGSVAAPTAGLHFTKDILDDLDTKKIRQEFLTLHVGAGTFKPVKADTMEDHSMHAEWIDVHLDTIRNVVAHQRELIAVGTTATRTLESLYWMGVKTVMNKDLPPYELAIKQWEVYDELEAMNVSKNSALESLVNWMERNKLERIFSQTELMIAPGYTFRMIDALVTNFHQPGSTLLLLVAAAIGDNWRKVYEYAMKNDFRFLSYGDGSLLFLEK